MNGKHFLLLPNLTVHTVYDTHCWESVCCIHTCTRAYNVYIMPTYAQCSDKCVRVHVHYLSGIFVMYQWRMESLDFCTAAQTLYMYISYLSTIDCQWPHHMTSCCFFSCLLYTSIVAVVYEVRKYL